MSDGFPGFCGRCGVFRDLRTVGCKACQQRTQYERDPRGVCARKLRERLIRVAEGRAERRQGYAPKPMREAR